MINLLYPWMYFDMAEGDEGGGGSDDNGDTEGNGEGNGNGNGNGNGEDIPVGEAVEYLLSDYSEEVVLTQDELAEKSKIERGLSEEELELLKTLEEQRIREIRRRKREEFIREKSKTHIWNKGCKEDNRIGEGCWKKKRERPSTPGENWYWDKTCRRNEAPGRRGCWTPMDMIIHNWFWDKDCTNRNGEVVGCWRAKEDEGTNKIIENLLIDDTELGLDYLPEVPVYIPPTQKEIRSIIIKDSDRPINPNGETRPIIIKGDPGATFTLTATTVSGCSILYDEVENFQLPSNGKHQVNVKFPKLDANATSETFALEITPAANSTLDELIKAGPAIYNPIDLSAYPDLKQSDVDNMRNKFPIKIPNVNRITKLYQYENPTVTFTNTSTQTSPALTVTGSDVTKTGKVKTLTEGTAGYTSSTYTLTIVEDPTDTAGSLYVKDNPDFNDNITNDKTIKKVVRRETHGENTSTSVLRLDPSTTMTDSDGIITGDLVIGMRVKGCVSYTKTVVTGVGTDNCYLPVSQFKLYDTNDLFEGMIVSGEGVYDYPVIIVSVDCDGNIITLSSKHIIRNDTALTFEHCVNTTVTKVATNSDVDGRACVTIRESVVPDLMELSFTEDSTVVDGIIKQSGSGSGSITLTTEVDVIKFGKKDITHTINLDNFITTTPNAYNQDVLVKKDTATGIYLLKGDLDSNISSKTATVVGNPHNGIVGSWSTTAKTVTYTPHTGFIGLDSFTFTMSDGTNSSEEKRIFITVN